MKAIVFAGGIGTRLWPLSRQNSPKQFDKIIGDKSTLQLTIERLRPDFDWQDIYISTGSRYVKIIKKQLPNIPDDNFIVEPEMRDVAPAIGLTMIHLRRRGLDNEPIAILWSDHLLKKITNFKKVLKFANDYIQKEPDKFVFIGQIPRFASDNLGWIEFGELLTDKKDFKLYSFKSWHYRPEKKLAQKYLEDKHHVWNVGYLVAKPKLILSYYQKLAPDFYNHLTNIEKKIGSPNYLDTLKTEYHQLEKTSFDNLILEKIQPSKGVVVKVELGWADIGTWESLWEIMDKDKNNNLSHGQVISEATTNSLIYNYDKKKIVVNVGLDNFVIVNTEDVILVCPKNASGEVKKLVKKLQKKKKYAQYT